MANRRQILASGVVLSSAALVPALHARAGWDELVAPGIELFLYDMRFEESMVLAKVAQQNGIPIMDTSGDLMDVWYDNLDLRWKQAPMTLAGATSAKTLFVLETLATDHGMSVVHRSGQHELTDTQYAAIGDTTLVQWIIAPRNAPKP